jgi:signal transduction histidine kinase
VKAAGPNTQQADTALLEQILEAAGEGIVFVRSDNTIGYINKVGREILRCSLRDDPPPTCVELTTLLGFDPLAFSQEGAVTGKSLNDREAGVDADTRSNPDNLSSCSWQQEATIFGVPYLVCGSPVSTGAPDCSGTVLYFQDLREAQQREQIMSENLSFASHELLTPITAIKNALDLLGGRRLGELSDKQLRFLQLAARNVERLNNVVTAVLDLSQLEKRSVTLQLKEVDVVEPLGRALATLEGLAQEKGITLHRQLQDHYPKLLADADRLRQVVYNLVHNAIKFTPEGGNVQVSLEVVPFADLSVWLPEDGSVPPPKHVGDESLLFTVVDAGEGIPASHLTSIFAKFHQGQGPSADQGTRGRGLGLAIVKTVVEAHGGTVWAESEPDAGSTFRVLLPKLSREAYLIQTAAGRLERVKAVGSSLTLVILRVDPGSGELVPETQQEEVMAALLSLVVETAGNTVRLKSDTVDILDSSRRTLFLLAEIEPKDVPALLQRVMDNLKKQSEKIPQICNLHLVWGMSSYPRDVSTTPELVAEAMQAVAGTDAEVISLEET